MRTNIVIDDALMAAAMEAGGFRTKKDAVEEGLRLLARRSAYQNIRAMRGKMNWDDGTGDRVPSGSVHMVQEPSPTLKAAVRPAAASKAAVKGRKP